jgi:hypothetical protein
VNVLSHLTPHAVLAGPYLAGAAPRNGQSPLPCLESTLPADRLGYKPINCLTGLLPHTGQVIALMGISGVPGRGQVHLH